MRIPNLPLPSRARGAGTRKGKTLFLVLASLALSVVMIIYGDVQDLTTLTASKKSSISMLSQRSLCSIRQSQDNTNTGTANGRGHADEDRVGGVLVEKVPLVYNYECPDLNNIDRFLHKGIDPDGANMLSYLSGALTTVTETLAGLRDKKIVIIGDSVMHQIYSSLSCLSHRAGAWESNTSFVGDRRAWLKNGSEIMYCPWGGNLLQFDWKQRTHDQPSSDDPFYDNTDWIEACGKREPFHLVAYNKIANSMLKPEDVSARMRRLSNDPMDHSFQEKIVLTRDDNVFISGTLHNHGVHRIGNMQKLHSLFQCMEEAKSANEDPGWPTITYIATPPQHFPGHADGRWAGGPIDLSLTCRHTVNLSHNQFYNEDNQLEGKVPMIGREIGASNMGQYHMGLRRVSNRQMTVDCTHWSMPGVTDIYAKVIMKSIGQVSHIGPL
ncbi:hypothetical protein ACHAXM_007191 [Skeletonema potamos]